MELCLLVQLILHQHLQKACYLTQPRLPKTVVLWNNKLAQPGVLCLTWCVFYIPSPRVYCCHFSAHNGALYMPHSHFLSLCIAFQAIYVSFYADSILWKVITFWSTVFCVCSYDDMIRTILFKALLLFLSQKCLVSVPREETPLFYSIYLAGCNIRTSDLACT